MDNRFYSIRISPENINGDIFNVIYSAGTNIIIPPEDPCCEINPQPIINPITGQTGIYSGLSFVLSGGTNGNSLLTGLTIPILLTENTVDIGYYSVFDGFVTQQDVMLNFLFSANTLNPYTYYFYNTSDLEFKKYLSFSNYKLDWGDGSPVITVNSISPNFLSHTYPLSSQDYTITFSGVSPWGINIIQKTVTVPYSNLVISNPQGTAYFIPFGGSWSATPLQYNYLFSGDAECILPDPYFDDYGAPIPFQITGYTKSTIKDLAQVGKREPFPIRLDGIYVLDSVVTGATGVVGVVYSSAVTSGYTGYTINGVDYRDYKEGFTTFSLFTSGLTQNEIVCSAITKNEILMNVIDEIEIQSDVFIERGKVSALESFMRLNEVNNVGDLEIYGYKYYNIIKI